METATIKRCLLLSFTAAALLGILCADGAPAKKCPQLHTQLSLYKLQEEATRRLRNKYEQLMKQEPWRNCSTKHRRPSWKLHDLTGWEKLEALEKVVSLSIRVLQNHSEEVGDKIVEPVLEALMPLRIHLKECIIKKSSGHSESENFHKFKQEFQKFKASNLEQSPQCLEAAVGLIIHHLLKSDIRHHIG